MSKRIICAEPSPDVAQSISKAIQTNSEASTKGAVNEFDTKSAEFGYSSVAVVVQLGERLATN